MKLIVASILTLMIFLASGEKPLSVISRTHASKIYAGFALKPEDIVINFEGSKYLVWSKEYFDTTGEIDSLIENHDIDYERWSRLEMYKWKNFFKDNNYSKFMNASLIGKHQLKINSTLFYLTLINTNQKEIFYKVKNEKDGLYIINYR